MSGKQFAVIVIITFIVGMIWLVSDIIFNTKASISVSPQLETALQPVSPNFESKTLEVIAREVSGEDLIETPQAPIAPIVPITPSPAASQRATQSANLRT